MATPAKPAKQVQQVQKKTVSVAAIFKRQDKLKATAKADSTHHSTQQPSKLYVKTIAKDDEAKINARSPQEAVSKVTKQKRVKLSHPLDVSFKETSTNYRRHLYEAATLSINKTLESALQALHDNTLQAISSDGPNSDPAKSPLKLTIPAKFEREANKIYQPLSHYQIRLTCTNAQGEREQVMRTLDERMQDYEKYIADQKREIEKLTSKWELIVGEIWKLGSTVLGDEAMERLLFKDLEDGAQASPSASKAESTLFVPEDSPDKPVVAKRVKFQPTRSTTENLAFLYQPTRSKIPVAVVAELERKDVDDMEKGVATLGEKHLADMRAAQEEHDKWWKKKRARITKALGDD